MCWDKLAHPKLGCSMGFMNIRDFNIAMLCKQGWRLICNSNSLVGRVYRASYYSSGSFLDSKLGAHPSFFGKAY